MLFASCSLETGELRDVLVEGKGAVLCLFDPHNAEAVRCALTGATNWPPLIAPDDKGVIAGEGLDQSLLGVIDNPSGGEVATYDGWPLYRYAADRRTGEHRGQDIKRNGGE